MADIRNSTVDEEIGSSQTGTGNGDGAGGGGDGGSLDEQTATIATRPDLVVGTRRFRLESLVASEGYNIGWCAHAFFAFGVPGGGASRIDILATLADRGLSPGRRGRVNLRVEAEGNELLHNQTIRTWPCMVSQMVPLDSEDDTRAACRIQLVDPLGYLASREIWGAYRDVSAAELVGGAIALAAGADEGPTTEVTTAWLPKIRVRGHHRDALDVIPYAVASGETLGEWLARVLGTLGLRAELFAEDGGDTQVVYLTDALAHRASYEMHVERDGVELSDDEQGRDGGISIRSRAAFPGNPLRGALLDDPTQGTPRVLVGFGPVGRVVRAQGADADEVTERAWHEVRRGFCEALMVRAASGHPGIEPGCTITLNETINRIDHWQVASARHLVSEGAYDNDATLLRADTAWHPPEPEPRGTVIVSAMVDHSEESLYHEPVPRDRLGRINVRFSFLPPPNTEVAYALAKADTNLDGRVTLDDYDEETTSDYTADADEWEKKAQAYENGDYADPYPGIADKDLTEEQATEREERTRQRQEAIAYMYYKRLAAPPPSPEDGTQDGTADESETDDEDDEDDDNPTAESTGDQGASETQDEQTVNDGSGAAERTRAGNVAGAIGVQTKPISGAPSIGERTQADNDGTETGEETQSGDDATEESEEDTPLPPRPWRLISPAAEADTLATPTPPEDRWPPRIALPVVEPMAGAMHSFVGGHRQGDICRVAVHDPFTAEIVGYQYRDNRPINRDVVGAAAAIVVEHNFDDAWTGIVVRNIADMDDAETAEEEDTEEDETDEKDTDEKDTEAQDSTDDAPAAPAAQTTESQTEIGAAGSKDGGTTEKNPVDENLGGTLGGTQDGGQ
ncbi:MAG: hypothetical protein OXC08_01245 [Thiotrichales bacterium]|nr:hypothetical protein [Thiotrichales bacterium]